MASILDFLTGPTGLGLGLTAAGSFLDREPGEALEARQALRNQFNAPYSALLPDFSRTGIDYLTNTVNAPADPFAAGGVYEQYLPAFQREEDRSLTGLQTRYNAAFPAGLGMQGSAVAALRRAASEMVQNRQTLQANIFREQQAQQQNAANSLLQYGTELPNLQGRAARSVLEFSRPDPSAQAIANLGTIMALSGVQGGGRGGFGYGGGTDALSAFIGDVVRGATTGNPGLDEFIKTVLGGAAGGGGGAGAGAGGALSGLGSGLGSLLSSPIPGLGISIGTFLGAFGAGTAGTLGGGALGRGLFGATDESRGASGIGGGLGSALGAILGSLVAPGVGTVIGAGLGGGAGGLAGAGIKQPDISRRETFQGALGGGLFGGAGAFLAGQGNQSTGKNLRDAGITGLATLLFGPAGGAIAGGILGKQRGAASKKAQFRSQDADSQRDQVFEEGTIGATLLQQAGVSQPVMEAWQGFVDLAAARSEGPGDEQGEVATELNRLLTAAGYPSEKRPPAWRQQWIDHLIASTFTSGNSRFGGGPPLNLIGAIPSESQGSWGQLAGF